MSWSVTYYLKEVETKEHMYSIFFGMSPKENYNWLKLSRFHVVEMTNA